MSPIQVASSLASTLVGKQARVGPVIFSSPKSRRKVVVAGPSPVSTQCVLKG